jgi:hypothetical protein
MARVTFHYLFIASLGILIITLHSKTFEEHIEHIKEVFEKLRDSKVKVKLSKCKFFAKRVRILGHIISKDHVKTFPHVTEALIKRPPPKPIKELEQFLGLANYYRRFVLNFSKIAKPLNDLKKRAFRLIGHQIAKKHTNSLLRL